MQVRLSAYWTDPDGTVRSPGETVDVDAVTLARMEEQGMVENSDSQTTSDAGTTTGSTSKPQKIGPGPTTPPENIGPGPTAPPADDIGK
ncbi:hypothetical protein [Micromonospora rifamycinica]|uniref:Uncharacterized protein n=1 Tax=Micromonospora rifamycinica TaxID=291594 RepID=A0A109IKF5_9ACTN|nr:hypothetical protein [Micromonospora rifamycinica]KWV32214.1 hypothetical protein AWV63_13685 [Micromonospora rifamycinica]SCG81012.1 hypothetical protein GA0070623_5384 [Micromonospora rifamycinica]